MLSYQMENKILTEKVIVAESAIKEKDRMVKKLSELCHIVGQSFQNTIKSKLKLSEREMLINLYPMSDGHLFIFRRCFALMHYPTDEKMRQSMKGKPIDKKLVVSYKKLHSLERYDHVAGPAIWFHLLMGPINPIKVHGFWNREGAMADVIAAAAAVGISVFVKDS